MIRVFLVEDETIIREGLREIIPWQQYGFTLVGDAGDGEQALPMIRELRPDVLITDIKMPFMDGLALSNLVSREFPAMKIIIISGYDDFEYARQAIRIGVEQYLLKPITKTMLIKSLNEVQEKIQSEREQEHYLEKFRSEVQEYEQFSRRRFFEQVVAGQLSVEAIYEKAAELNISIHAQCYNLMMYEFQTADREPEAQETVTQIRDSLTRFFMMYPEYLMFRWNLTTYAVLVKGEEAKIDELTQRCTETLRMNLLPYEDTVEWHVAIGQPTRRLSMLPDCFREVSHIFSFRHLLGREHVLTKERTNTFVNQEDSNSLKSLDMTKIDPAILHRFLQNGQISEVQDFVNEYVGGMRTAAASKMFCQYLMLNVRFTALAYIEELGYSKTEFSEQLPDVQKIESYVSIDEMKQYICEILNCALEIREKESRSQSRDMIRLALDYIDQNFADESISLKEVAGYTNVSANYFSAMFSQEMQQTFVEYLTQKRMERAKELLRQTEKRTAEIAAEVGFRDPHYFSFVFRKTQGCTPRDYRTGGKRG